MYNQNLCIDLCGLRQSHVLKVHKDWRKPASIVKKMKFFLKKPNTSLSPWWLLGSNYMPNLIRCKQQRWESCTLNATDTTKPTFGQNLSRCILSSFSVQIKLFCASLLNEHLGASSDAIIFRFQWFLYSENWLENSKTKHPHFGFRGIAIIGVVIH